MITDPASLNPSVSFWCLNYGNHESIWPERYSRFEYTSSIVLRFESSQCDYKISVGFHYIEGNNVMLKK